MKNYTTLRVDEAAVLDVLKNFGALKRAQVERFIVLNASRIRKDMTEDKASRIVDSMIKNRLITPCGTDELSNDLQRYGKGSTLKTDNAKTQYAFSVLLAFMAANKVQPGGYLPSNYPSSIAFLSTTQLCEIVIVDNGEEVAISRIIGQQAEEVPEVCYILVITDKTQANTVNVPEGSILCFLNRTTNAVSTLTRSA